MNADIKSFLETNSDANILDTYVEYKAKGLKRTEYESEICQHLRTFILNKMSDDRK